jgi:hypothetical protein
MMPYTEEGRLAWLEKSTTLRINEWGYAPRPSGGYIFWKPGMFPGGLTTDREDKLKERALRELKENGKYSSATNWQISAYGILKSGKISVMEGGKYLGLPPGRLIVTPEMISQAVKDFWAPCQDRKQGCYVPTQVGSPTEFGRVYPAIYKHMSRKENGGGFKVILDRMYRGLYDQIGLRNCIHTKQLRLNRLRKELISRSNEGHCISPNWLKSSPLKKERELGFAVEEFREGLFPLKKKYSKKKVISQGKNGRSSLSLGETPSEAVSNITGFPLSQCSISMGANKRLSVIPEGLTSFLLHWSRILNVQPFGFDLDQEPPHIGEVLFLQGEQEYFSDFRFGNSPVEVKNAFTHFNNRRIAEINRKYVPESSRWKDGKSLEDLVLFFHAPMENYSSSLDRIEVPLRQIIHYKDFHEELKKLITKMKRVSHLYHEVRPLCNMDDLIELHEESSLHPFLLIRDGNTHRLNWHREVLKEMNKKARQLIFKEGDQDELF